MEKLTKIFETIIPAICSVAAVSAFLYIIIMLTLYPTKDLPNKDILLILFGVLVGIVKDLYGYWFGSSAGSKAKTELMDKINTVKNLDQK